MFLKLMIAALVATGGAAVVGIGGNTSKTGDNKPKPQAGQSTGDSANTTPPQTGSAQEGTGSSGQQTSGKQSGRQAS